MITARLGQAYNTVPTSAGDFQVVYDPTSGLNTVFDPAGNIVTDFSQLSNSVTNALNSAMMGGSTTGAPANSGTLFLWAALAVIVLGLLSGGRR